VWCLPCSVHFPAQYVDWVNEAHIEERLSGNFYEIWSRFTQIGQFGKTLVLSVARCPGSAAEQHALNEGGGSGDDYVAGIHYHAIVIIPPIDKRRWKRNVQRIY
jgi:hypothetical protein